MHDAEIKCSIKTAQDNRIHFRAWSKFSIELWRVWINVLQRYSSLILPRSKIHKQKTYHTEGNHTRLFLVSSLEKLNYRRRSIRLFALLLDATAYWHRIILVLFGLCRCVGVWSTGDDGQGMVPYTHERQHSNSPLHTFLARSLPHSLAIRFGSSSVSHFSRFSCSFFFFGLFFYSLLFHNTNTNAQTDRQNWSHQLTHEIHHYHRTYLRLPVCLFECRWERATHYSRAVCDDSIHITRIQFDVKWQVLCSYRSSVERSGFYSARRSHGLSSHHQAALDQLVFIHFVLHLHPLFSVSYFLPIAFSVRVRRWANSIFLFSCVRWVFYRTKVSWSLLLPFLLLPCLRVLKWNGIVSARFCIRTRTPYRRRGL